MSYRALKILPPFGGNRHNHPKAPQGKADQIPCVELVTLEALSNLEQLGAMAGVDPIERSDISSDCDQVGFGASSADAQVIADG